MDDYLESDYQWQEFHKDFDYVKDFYEVRLPDGTIISKCWPNAGKMNAPDGRKWKEGVEVRLDKKNMIGWD